MQLLKAFFCLPLLVSAAEEPVPGATGDPKEQVPETPQDSSKKKGEESWVDTDSQGTGYYGSFYKGERIVFCLDTSDSMKLRMRQKYANDSKGSPERIKVAKKELIKAIENLSYDKEFAVIFFDGGVTSWPGERHLRKANASAKQEAIEKIREKPLVFGTEILGALEEAFEYAKVDTILFLTDGKPYSFVKDAKNAGRHPPRDLVRSDPKTICETVAKLNKKRKVAVHTIAMGENCDVAFLQKLAEENGGTFKQVGGQAAPEESSE